MGFRAFFLFLYVGITAVLFTTFQTSIGVWMSFFLNAMLLTCILIHHLFIERDYAPFISCYIVFTYLFFLVAPIVQINAFDGVSNPLFMTQLPYDESVAIYANYLIIFFNLLFFLSYLLFKKSQKIKGWI